MDHRHHRASRDVQVIIVPVPCGGSPEPLRHAKPGLYPRQGRGYVASQRPVRRIKGAEALKRLLDEFRRQDRIVSEMMQPRADLMRAWVNAA